MNRAFVTFAIGSICYGLSTLFAIRVRGQLAVPAAAALAPTIAYTGLLMTDRVTSSALLLPCIASAIVLLIARRSVLEVVSHAALFWGSVLLLGLAGTRTSALGPLALSLVGALVYAVGDGVLAIFTGEPGDRRDRMMWLILVAVVICAAGLTYMVADRQGWPAFVAIVGALAVTRTEFEAFGKSRLAFDQTVRALEGLRRAE